MDYDDYDNCQESCDDGNATPAALSFGNTKPWRHDKDRHPLMTIVDRSGIHEIGSVGAVALKLPSMTCN